MESETENGSQATIGYRSRLIDLRSPNGDQMRNDALHLTRKFLTRSESPNSARFAHFAAETAGTTAEQSDLAIDCLCRFERR